MSRTGWEFTVWKGIRDRVYVRTRHLSRGLTEIFVKVDFGYCWSSGPLARRVDIQEINTVNLYIRLWYLVFRPDLSDNVTQISTVVRRHCPSFESQKS